MKIKVDKDTLVKLVNEGILEMSTKGRYGFKKYVYANSDWSPIIFREMTLLKYDDDFFEHAYIDTFEGLLDSDGEAVDYITEEEMSQDEIEQFIRDTGKKFMDTYLEMKNRETMRALDALS